ncbi:DNA binding protein putative isoform 1 [Tripterygium wilfordii]|uniref:DNA binding protein putative isoform 1 n=1 Tax=Tripterygium wilfordii TaxID=458696 RepID=A0A7J7CCX0_TRIWF|nr:B3 domain-containing protein REM14-like [Tripterygium wilfordii]KAF5731785.1 DNA binding protein putative isoform 1 [Tripterygium wilfordii]
MINQDRPHFIKPINDDFGKEFLIPLKFMRHLEPTNDLTALIRSPTSKNYYVRIDGRKIENNWAQFAVDHDLHLHDILMFEYTDNMVFKLMVFDSDGLAKEFRQPDEDIPEEANKPKFKAIITPSTLRDNRLLIPIAFARSTNLADKIRQH